MQCRTTKDKRSKVNKNTIIRAIVLSVLSVVILFVYFYLHKLYEAEGRTAVSLILCDGFFIVAAINLGFAGLRWAAYEGTFDILSYGIRHIFVSLRRPGKNYVKDQTFGDYVLEKNASRKLDLWIELIIGGTFMIVCLIFFIIYKTSI